MCGIFGVVTNENISLGKMVFEGIKRLEYRGYDSCGIVTLSDSKLFVKKDAGKIDEIQTRMDLSEFPDGSKLALAHTRWATHGSPTRENSHPHLDCAHKIAVVHNGIIDNFIELREELKLKGHNFKSETDTEVLPHLIEEFMKESSDLKYAIASALERCRGTYGIAVCHTGDPDTIIVARKESPIVIGIEEGKTTYCASDIPAFLPLTRKCYILEDHELAVLKPGQAEFYNLLTNEKVEKDLNHIEWSIDAAEKNGYEHFMLKEIYEEPDALRRTMLIPKESIRMFAGLIWGADHIFITAAGTSFYAALAGKFIITRFLNKYIYAIECSEFQNELSDTIKDNSVIIAISQSGETIDTIEAIRWAKEQKGQNIKILTITNVVGSSLTRYSDFVIVTQAGPEIGVAATKTYCTQVLTLGLVALEIARLRKILDHNELRKYYEALNSTPKIIQKFLDNSISTINNIVSTLEKSKNFFFLARGISIATAKEGGLKLKEVACRFIEGYSAADAKHGPISLVREGFPIVFIAPPDETYERLVGNVMEFKARGGKIISLVVEDDKTIANLSDLVIRIPQPGDKYHNIFSPITFTPALQLLAYYTSLYHGLDPDKPLNLSKTVTVH
ncbi:MAG: glutamine--fructose-6-phosphate transaminase (isomerizing) [Promethearchaeota archaeon]|nr:MAG: glutamine--fructose-6-phosphate transaminase (isomerizing) [Candidatus Lokiarchaeota archaeon]